MANFRTRFLVLAAIVLGITSPGTSALETSTITFDPQGTGGANGITIGGFDWGVNSILTEDAIPLQDGTTTLQSYAHDYVEGPIPPPGGTRVIPGLNSDFELTYTAGMKYVATASGNTVQIDTICPDQPPISPLYCENDIGDNFFRLYIDNNVNSNSLTGDNYADGKLILEGKLIATSGNTEVDADPLELLDSYLTDQWSGTTTVTEDGALQIIVLVDFADPDYFPDLEASSLIPFSTQTVLSFKEVDPSRKFATSTGFATSDVGNINGINGPDFLEQTDPNNAFSPQQAAVGCRVTGGGNESFGLTTSFTGWDGSTASTSVTVTETVTTEKGNSGKFVTEEVTTTSEATFGGQAGANTASQPQPKGELEHHQKSGPEGQWGFHMGTASAPPGTEVDIIQCSDPGWCRQARPAPAKQIDFAGIGTFQNIIDEGNLNDSGQCASVTKLKGKPSERSIGTYNWAEYHIEDHGERGREGQHFTVDPVSCPADGTGTDAFSAYNGTGSRVDAVAGGTYNSFECKTDNDPTTECPDFYRIRIYCGVEPTFDADGNLSNFDEIAAQKANGPIYEMKGYIDGGNWQIHPQTGFDLR